MDRKQIKKTDKEISIEDLKKEFQECQKLRDEYLAGWQRSRADFLNYKKEEAERIESLVKYTVEGFAAKLLPILDNFELASKQKLEGSLAEENGKKIIEGFLNIKKQLQDFLKSCGLKEIETWQVKFDPNFHEIVEEVEDSNQESGIILEEIQKGYLFENHVLRPARVKVTR